MNPLNCLKSRAITLVNTFPRNKFAGQNESAFTPVCSVLWFLFARKNFANSYFPNLFIYMIAVNAASSFDNTVFHAFLTCSVPVSMQSLFQNQCTVTKFFVGSLNHENIFTQKFKTRKVPDLWYGSAFYVGISQVKNGSSSEKTTAK